MEWSIHDLAGAAGTTSRTLRHYGELGLLPPSRIGSNGYRYYDSDSLVQLQRILLLRQLGLGLKAIADVLSGHRNAATALHTHLELLEGERKRIERQIASVRTTLRKLKGGEQLMPEEAFDGFDSTKYEQEVSDRWGRDAYVRSDRWWRGLSAQEQQAFQQRQLDIAAGFGRARAARQTADSEEVQELARQQVEWLALTQAGTQARPTRAYVTGLGAMYVADPRFTAHYDRHGDGTAVLIRDALAVYAQRHLTD